MTFTPQSMQWPADRAVLLVHGIGRASLAGDAAFPLEAFRTALGQEADRVAIYTLNYDFINDWLVTKTALGAEIRRLKRVLSVREGGDDQADVIADYAGDVLWPVLSADLRLAVRSAYLAQLIQIQLDGAESAFSRGQDPLDNKLSIVAHSLGCFHTYEALWEAATEPTHRLRPASDLFRLASVWLMASPVQLIRSVAEDIKAVIPSGEMLATLSMPLGIPREMRHSKPVTCTDAFISVTGTQDPVGGHLLGGLQKWAYMHLTGQRSIVVPQHLTNVTDRESLALALQAAASGETALQLNDPHSWSRYITSQTATLREVLLT